LLSFLRVLIHLYHPQNSKVEYLLRCVTRLECMYLSNSTIWW